jgi:hypothetical protein
MLLFATGPTSGAVWGAFLTLQLVGLGCQLVHHRLVTYRRTRRRINTRLQRLSTKGGGAW